MGPSRISSFSFQDITEQSPSGGHKIARYFTAPDLNLEAVIAIHDDTLGPGLGGCRVREYRDVSALKNDAFALSQGMTHKNALAEIPFGGAKACIRLSPAFLENRRAALLRFADFVETFAGGYISAEDMGTTVEDIMIVRERTKHVCCVSEKEGGIGDPSPWTALGVFHGIRAAIDHVYPADAAGIAGKIIAVQGLGKVGMPLTELLIEAGALVIAGDPDEKLCGKASKLGARIVPPEDVAQTECDIYAPCAMGQVLNADSIPRLNCAIIAGAANNQILGGPEISLLMIKRGLVYAPDFAINAGGAIAAASEFIRAAGVEERTAWVREKTKNIYDTIKQILAASSRGNLAPEQVAVSMAMEKINYAGRKLIKGQLPPLSQQEYV